MLLKTYFRNRYIFEKDLRVRWFSHFPWKNNFLSLLSLLKSGLNDIFHWCAHSAIFCKSLFNSYALVLASWIMEKSDVLSAKNLTGDMISIDRLLVQTRKKRDPQVDPCGTPALTSNHSAVWPFKKTLWNLFSKKFLIRSNKASQITIDLSFKMSPSCHILSKALEISKKNPRDSRVGYS